MNASPPAEGHALVGGLVVLAVVDAVADLRKKIIIKKITNN